MKNMRRWVTLCVAVILGVLGLTRQVRSQTNAGGDQILDGIGETGLIARYVLNGNVTDASRNNHTATLGGAGATFVDDAKFGRALSLSGDNGSFLQIDKSSLGGEDTLSVTGWVMLSSAAPGQRFFDFGKNANSHFFLAPTGVDAATGLRAQISGGGTFSAQGPPASKVAVDKWVHLAAVLDAATHTLSAYVDGVLVGQTRNVEPSAQQIIVQDEDADNFLYFGKSQTASDPLLKAKLRDLRIYRVALSEEQIAKIRDHNPADDAAPATGRRGRRGGAGGARGANANTSRTAITIPPLTGPMAKITAVPDITAETIVGNMPHLPITIPATYPAGEKGPDVRVIWPSPTDNAQVQKAGTYVVMGKVPGTKFEPKATVTVKAGADTRPVPTRKLEAFPLGEVLLNKDSKGNDTQFIKNRDKFVLTLADTNPDNFLYMFRATFGQPQPAGATPLRGWDSEGTRLRGHATGHYLSAVAQAYASTSYDKELQAKFEKKMNYLIDTLYDLSQKSGKPAKEGGESNADPAKVPFGPGKTAYDSDFTAAGLRTDYQNWGKGFISAYPPDQFIMLENGATYGSRNNQIWAPYYTLHKIIAGLLDCYEVGGNKKALEIAQNMGLWVNARLKPLPTETRIAMWNRYIAGEYGGMNEVMARLYRLTKDQKFIETAKLFDNIDFFYGGVQRAGGLALNVDTLRGKHANQHLPQITGALETYRDTNEAPYYHIADNFWNICNEGYMYSIGGVAGALNPSNSECFVAQPNTLWENGFNPGGQNETCATYNLLKLDRQMFMFDQNAKYMDHYEQGMYNHILASVAEDSPANTYHVPLNPGARKQFGNANMSGFTCCNGTALESSTKLQDSIYFRATDGKTLYVNLYVPSTLNWTERSVSVEQKTAFPYADSSQLTLKGAGEMDVKLRVPSWATKGFTVTINGAAEKIEARPGTYITLHRTWKDGDTIEVKMPFTFHLDPVMDQPNINSIFYGPILLAAQEPAARNDWRPLTLEAADLGKNITGDPATLTFKLDGVDYKPFFLSYGRYSVYENVTLK